MYNGTTRIQMEAWEKIILQLWAILSFIYLFIYLYTLSVAGVGWEKKLTHL
jgi:hypothetical protein